jgi:hypothetical protein
MPLARYFLVVGGALLLVLLFAGAFLPSLPAVERAETKRSEIRIHSTMKLPERVVFDTSASVVATLVEPATAEIAPATLPSVEYVGARARQAFAQVQSPDPNKPKLSDPRRPGPKAAHARKTQTRHAATLRKMRFARHQSFDWFGNRMWW